METLAEAAEAHARHDHGTAIGLDNVAAADRILHAESGRLDPERLESLAACYGAWLGRVAVRQWNARWVGLFEPSAPRLRLGGVLLSPIDAVRRRLTDPSAPSLSAILRQLESWARPDPAASADNREAWDRLAADPRFAGAIDPSGDPAAALDEWLRAEGVRGKSVLCLGAGGGRQGPLFSAAGAKVTVVDFSERQLDHDRKAGLQTVCASIDDLRALAPASFDLVVQPVSACYVPDVERVYAEVARVIQPGGLYIVQHKQPANLQAADDLRIAQPSVEGAALPPSTAAHREPGTVEYLHGLDALLGGLCRAGFVIEDVVEPPRADALAPAGSPGHRAWFLPPYLKIKARRR
ncbi:MAG: class I SAM-dependent methyltransferase [Planctomycetota bacterium]|nr:MAG: class I SAM-dependent methyltransferase [Planctomycetota bacterium]